MIAGFDLALLDLSASGRSEKFRAEDLVTGERFDVNEAETTGGERSRTGQIRDRLAPAFPVHGNDGSGLQHQDSQAFENVVHQYEAPIGRYLNSLVGDYEIARDLSQDTFISAYRSYEPGKIRNLQAWLYRIATNKAMSHFRRRKILSWVQLDKLIDAGLEPGVDGHGESVAKKSAIQQALDQLEPEKRACLLLKASGFSHHEIAGHLGCSPGAARTRMSRARDEFRVLYKGDDYNL